MACTAGHGDMLLGDARKNELIAICAGDVESQLHCHSARGRRIGTAPRRWSDEPSVDEISLVPGGGESVDQFGAHLVATTADARSNGGNEVPRPRTELATQRFDGSRRRSRRGSSPTRVNSGNGPGHRVGQRGGTTIGGANREPPYPQRSRRSHQPRAGVGNVDACRMTTKSRSGTWLSIATSLWRKRRGEGPKVPG